MRIPFATKIKRSLLLVRKNMTGTNWSPCAFAMSPFSVHARMPLAKMSEPSVMPTIITSLAKRLAIEKRKALARLSAAPSVGFALALSFMKWRSRGA